MPEATIVAADNIDVVEAVAKPSKDAAEDGVTVDAADGAGADKRAGVRVE
jgi:hypothetical protein